MRFIEFVKEKILKIPVSSKRTSFASLFGGGNAADSNYYTSWVYLAVSIIAQDIAGIQLKLFKDDSKGNVEQIFDHPAVKLLYRANDFMTQYDLFERLQSNQELKGNEYWFLPSGAGGPMSILPLRPENVSPIPDPDSYVKGYLYKLDNVTYMIPPKNMLHFKQFNPDSDIVGLSTLEAARLAADTDNFARQYNRNYFKNSARPDVILEFPETLSPEDEKRLIAGWNQSHGGPERQFRTAVASGGLKINAFQISQRDMEFLQGRQFNRDEIMAIFRVPLAIAGFTGNETYASAKAAAYAFGSRTLTPKMTRIVNTLNEFFLPLFSGTEGMYFEFESPVLEDRDAIIREYQAGLASGWLSINDVRRKEDLPEIEGGEPVFVPFNLQPLGLPIEGKAPKIEPINKVAKAIAKSFMDSVKKIEESIQPEQTKEQEARELKGAFLTKARNARGEEYEAQFNKILDTIWENQKTEAVKNLNQRLKTKEWRTKAVDLIDKPKEVKATIDLFTPFITALIEEEGKAAAEFLGAGEFTITRNLTKFIEQNTKKFAGEITEETSKKLRSSIAAGLEAGEAIPDLEKRILDSVAFSKSRAQNIARTETIRAQSKSSEEVWKESGVVEGKEWFTGADDRTCDLCIPMDGKIIGIGESFYSKGDVHEGDNGSTIQLDYENVDGPPLHPQCRCTLIPVV